ncbi:MAG: 50S ribosomal protein L5 [bacterium]|nr:50S ribosomal protein L5 [bacterium]
MNLKELYKKALPELMKQFGYKNPMAVPRVEKIVLNTGFGKQIAGKTGEESRKILESVIKDLGLIAGQRPVLTKAKKSVAGFKLREGVPIGAKVTLRGQKMGDFLERFIHVILPRSRDFRGIPLSAMDGSGNLTIGVKEHISFPEVAPEHSQISFGLEITIVTTAKTKKEGVELLKKIGILFQGEKK